MGITQDFARFIVDTGYDQLPPRVVDHVKQYILDGIGVSLGALDHPGADVLLGFAEEVGGKEQATVIGRGVRLSAPHAALVNGFLVHLLDLDDTYMPPETILHGTAPTMPAMLAVAEWKRLSGRQAIAAFALAFELMTRVSRGLGRAGLDAGWHMTSVVGTLGAGAVVGKLLGLDDRKMAYALGIAGTSAAGLVEMLGTMCKPYHPGNAAMHGVMAGLLAQRGFDSSEKVLEGEKGYAWAHSGSRDLGAAGEKLGSHWEMLDGGFKPYACGVVAHPTIDGVIALRNRHGLKPGEVVSIRARTNPFVLVPMGKMTPRTGLEGKFSVVHCAAVALVDGRAVPEQYTDARVNDPEVVGVRNRVTIVPDPSVREDEAWVEIALGDGRVLTDHVEHCLGSRDNPMGWPALRAKYDMLAEPVLGAAGASRVADLATRLDELADTGELVRATVR